MKLLHVSFLSLLLLLSLSVSGQTTLPVIKLIGEFNEEYRGAQIIIDGDTLYGSVKWRGGSTMLSESHKHNYKIKLNKKNSFFGMRRDNDWILDAGQVDPFRLRNRIATNLWLDMCTPPYYYSESTPALTGVRGQVVEVYLNDQYEGVYSFTECMDRKQLQVMKYGNNTINGAIWKGTGWIYSKMWRVDKTYDNTKPTWADFEAKYPQVEDYGITDYSTLYDAINFVVNSSDEEFAANVDYYFDIPAVMDYYLFYNALGAVDNVGKNIFWAVYNRNAADHRLTPAVWDLDLTVGAPKLYSYDSTFVSPYHTIFGNLNLVHRLITLNVDNFNTTAYNRWKELRQTYLSYENLSQRYYDAAQMLVESGAAQREKERWDKDSDIGGRTIDFMADADSIANWLNIHLSHLDTMLIDSLIIIRVGIEEIAADQPKHYDNAIYTLQGQRIMSKEPLRPGIYIRRGKKFVWK